MQKRKINILSRLLTVWRKELRFLQRRDWPAILLNTVRHRFSIYSFAYSLPAYRRMGLSGANFATCCRFLREQGYRRLLTRVEVGNIAALALCRKLGYQEVGQATLFKFLGRAVRRYTPRRYQR
jgi:RimJ/RimL family protein N-acetyltransferase